MAKKFVQGIGYMENNPRVTPAQKIVCQVLATGGSIQFGKTVTTSKRTQYIVLKDADGNKERIMESTLRSMVAKGLLTKQLTLTRFGEDSAA